MQACMQMSIDIDFNVFFVIFFCHYRYQRYDDDDDDDGTTMVEQRMKSKTFVRARKETIISQEILQNIH